MAAVSPEARRSRLWIWTIVAGGVLIGVFYLVREWAGDGATADVFYATVSLLATVSIAAGILAHRPARPLPWILLALGQLVYTVADVTYLALAAAGHDEFPNLSDVFYLLQFPLVIAALALIIRRRTPRWHAPTWIDAAVLGTAGTLVWWLYGVEPAMRVELSPAAQAVAVAYPVLDLLLLATAMRLVVGGGSRSRSFLLLVASLTAMMIGDCVFAVLTAAGEAFPGYWMTGVWLASYVFGAAAALHPSMRSLDARAPAPAPGATSARLATLAAASLLAPVVLLIEYSRTDDRGHEPAIAIACILLFLLVLTRMAGLVSVQRATAITDGLTGLRTRGYLNEMLASECARSRRGGEPVAVIIADVDHFKTVNDTRGHPAGDEVLMEIGRRLREVLRRGDTIARYGGEEFAVLLAGAGLAEATLLGERVRRAICDVPITVAGDRGLAVTVSVGVAAVAGRAADPEALVRAADQALYAAKRGGRNRVATTSRADVDLALVVADKAP
jgi:diguanylate cyclase (GGDEF)-like protein